MRRLGRLVRSRVAIALAAAALLAAIAAGLWWPRPAQLLRQGEQALAARENARARELLERYLASRPSDAGARLLAARAARRQLDFAAALEHLDRCRKDGGAADAIDVEYALIELRRDAAAPAAWLRERARQEDEVAFAILEGLIQHAIDTYQLQQALDDLNEYLRRRPTDLQALLSRGSIWEKKSLSFADAREDYLKAVAAHPHSEIARLRLADTLLLVGTPAEAQVHYQWLHERWPRRPEVRLGLARCELRQGNLAEAERLLDALLADAPSHGEALWERGQVAIARDRPEEAEPWLQKATSVLPHDRRIVYSLEQCLRVLGRKEEADRCQARVAELDADVRQLEVVRQQVMQRPGDANLRVEAGVLFLRNGEPEEGRRWLRLALRLDPSCAAARQALAEDAQQKK